MEIKGKIRPGGELSKRFLDLTILADKSASMNEMGKMASLNTAIREALPHIKAVQDENPGACIRFSVMPFSHGAEWHNNEPTPIENFVWKDIVADKVLKHEMKNNGNLDIVFLIDTSGSMCDEIEAVKASCSDFAVAIEEKGLGVQLGLIGFDIGGFRGSTSNKFKVHQLSRYTIGCWPLASPKQFKENIKELSVGLFGGGGCYLADQDTIDIFPHVTDLFGQSKANKIVVIISDEIGDEGGLKSIVKTLNDAKIKSYVLGVSHKSAHKLIAQETGGEFWDIIESKGKRDFSTLLVHSVAETIGREAKKTLADGSVSLGTDMGAAMNLLTERIKVEVKDGILFIRYDSKGVQWGGEKRALKAYISIKDFDQLTVSGACDVYFTNTIAVDKLTLKQSGASDLKGKINIGELMSDVSGASDILLSGKVGNLDIEASGASSFKGYNLVAESCNAKASGASDIKINVNRELTAEASGASDIRYKGEGDLIKIKTSGSGSVSKSRS